MQWLFQSVRLLDSWGFRAPGAGAGAGAGTGGGTGSW